MAKFRKKPVVIEAVQWTGDNRDEVFAFVLDRAERMPPWTICKTDIPDEPLQLMTREGPMNASVGDFIIIGVQREVYACKPDIFAATYEPAE